MKAGSESSISISIVFPSFLHLLKSFVATIRSPCVGKQPESGMEELVGSRGWGGVRATPTVPGPHSSQSPSPCSLRNHTPGLFTEAPNQKVELSCGQVHSLPVGGK